MTPSSFISAIKHCSRFVGLLGSRFVFSSSETLLWESEQHSYHQLQMPVGASLNENALGFFLLREVFLSTFYFRVMINSWLLMHDMQAVRHILSCVMNLCRGFAIGFTVLCCGQEFFALQVALRNIMTFDQRVQL